MPKANFFEPGQDAPAVETLAITAHNTNDLTTVSRALWVGTGGDIALMASGDSASVILKNVPNGTLLPIRIKRVLITGTTAADLVALY